MHSRTNLLWAITEAIKDMPHDDLEKVYEFVQTLHGSGVHGKESQEEKTRIREHFIDEIERVKEQGKHKPGKDIDPLLG